jgi:hypothetical protein
MKLVLLYSEKDQDCMSLLNKISTIPDLKDITYPLCVEYTEIFNLLMTSDNIQIDILPTILSIDEENINRYDGQLSFDYISKIIDNINTDENPDEDENVTRKVSSLEAIGLSSPPSEKQDDQFNHKPNVITDKHTPSKQNKQDNSSPMNIKITSPKF